MHLEGRLQAFSFDAEAPRGAGAVAGGAGGGTTFEALQGADKMWERVRNTKVRTESLTLIPSPDVPLRLRVGAASHTAYRCLSCLVFASAADDWGSAGGRSNKERRTCAGVARSARRRGRRRSLCASGAGPRCPAGGRNLMWWSPGAPSASSSPPPCR